MSMLNSRLQVLIDAEQRERLELEAAAREALRWRRSSAAAIDLAYPGRVGQRRAASEGLLDLEPMEIPAADGLLDELNELRGRRG